MFIPTIKHATIAVAACAMLALPAFADTLEYTANLTADAEVPPTESSATGTANVIVDTENMTVSWKVMVEDLSGDPTAAHIHGPAGNDENAPPVINMSDFISEGKADITEEQISELEAGNYYVNVHTEKYPKGEIRGQLEPAD